METSQTTALRPPKGESRRPAPAPRHRAPRHASRAGTARVVRPRTPRSTRVHPPALAPAAAAAAVSRSRGAGATGSSSPGGACVETGPPPFTCVTSPPLPCTSSGGRLVARLAAAACRAWVKRSARWLLSNWRGTPLLCSSVHLESGRDLLCCTRGWIHRFL